MTASSFSARLADLRRRTRSALCAGIDPRVDWLPEPLRPSQGNREETARAFRDFSIAIVEAAADHCPIFKPQSAFFEALGWRGVRALEEVAAEIRRAGRLVIGDVKRGDIGTTAEAYADAAFDDTGNGPLFDAVTVNPWMGADALRPFIARAEVTGGGVFVLVKTSNPSASDLQDLRSDGRPVHAFAADLVRELAGPGADYSLVGAVVGATRPAELPGLRACMPRAWFLLPGVGAQGATMADTRQAFDADGLGALVNVSRALDYAWRGKDGSTPSDWRLRIATAARDLKNELEGALVP